VQNFPKSKFVRRRSECVLERIKQLVEIAKPNGQKDPRNDLSLVQILTVFLDHY
jgi:hypothetical protein